MLLCPALPPQAHPAPSPQTLRVGSVKAGFDIALASRRAAREMGATVVVEDDLLALPALPAGPRWGAFQWRYAELAPIPMPVWMDPSVTRAGGNVASRVYTFGGVGF